MAPVIRLKKTRRQGGLALVEMALVLPLLVLLLFALIEYGWLFYKYQQINGAARHGCRIGATQPATTAQVNAAIDTMMTGSGLGGSGYTKNVTPVEVLAGTTITVTVTVPYGNITLTGFPLPLPTNLVGEMSMVKEGAP
jgi:Flp pilus assembly protein TadG